MCCIWSSCSSCSWCSSWSWGGIIFIMFISNLIFSSKCITITCSLLQMFIFNTDHWSLHQVIFVCCVWFVVEALLRRDIFFYLEFFLSKRKYKSTKWNLQHMNIITDLWLLGLYHLFYCLLCFLMCVVLVLWRDSFLGIYIKLAAKCFLKVHYNKMYSF